MAPAVVVAFFYIRLGMNLIRRSRNQTRNRVLTLAFFLSWLMWILCWSPNISITIVQYYDSEDFGSSYLYYYEHYGDPSMEYFYSPFWTYTVSFRIPFQLLYSHLNPFIFLVVLKKFQKHFRDTLKWFLRIFLQTQFVQNSKSENGKLKNVSNIFKACISTFNFVIPWAILVITLHNASEDSSFLNSETFKASNLFRKVVDSSIKRSSRDNQVFRDWESNLNIRSECGNLGGLYNLSFKRCYFIIDHQIQPLNFSELMNSCQSNGGYLCYPRNKEEMCLIWNFFELWVWQNLNVVPIYDYEFWFAALYYEYYGLASYKQYLLKNYKAHMGFERLGKE